MLGLNLSRELDTVSTFQGRGMAAKCFDASLHHTKHHVTTPNEASLHDTYKIRDALVSLTQYLKTELQTLFKCDVFIPRLLLAKNNNNESNKLTCILTVSSWAQI